MSGSRAATKIHSCSWHETHRDATDLAARLEAHGPFRGIVAIARGGLVPAAIIARVLGIRLIETLCIASYDDEVKGPVAVLKPPPAEVGDGTGWLLVDDVADSGTTAEVARRLLPLAHYASVYVKPAGRPYVDSFIREIAQDVWVDFPWERAPAKIG
jgi:xanthine phosphoribosyltransferase